MSICKHCRAIGGTHKPLCPVPHAPAEYRIEITGNIQVHHPITTDKGVTSC